jgi:predicted nucleic acid-binding protein
VIIAPGILSTMTMIVDASVAVPWLVQTPFSANARKLRTHSGCAPAFLFVETANVLLKYHRLTGIPLEDVEAGLRQLQDIVTDVAGDGELLPVAVRISAENNHKVYDCLYLALALGRREPLATADRRLAALAQKLSIETELIEPSL